MIQGPAFLLYKATYGIVRGIGKLSGQDDVESRCTAAQAGATFGVIYGKLMHDYMGPEWIKADLARKERNGDFG